MSDVYLHFGEISCNLLWCRPVHLIPLTLLSSLSILALCRMRSQYSASDAASSGFPTSLACSSASRSRSSSAAEVICFKRKGAEGSDGTFVSPASVLTYMVNGYHFERTNRMTQSNSVSPN